MISSNNPEHQRFGIKVIRDAQPDCGPMMGLYSCLKASADSVNFVVSVDTPLVPKGLFNEMLKVIGPAQVMVPYHGNEKYEPVIGVYSRDVLEYMERLFAQGLYRLPDLFKQVRFEGYRVGDGQPFSNSGYFYNINTQDDLTLLENRQ
jgi:molybdopterin-guanine dinucleotide biosynthesis protein A